RRAGGAGIRFDRRDQRERRLKDVERAREVPGGFSALRERFDSRANTLLTLQAAVAAVREREIAEERLRVLAQTLDGSADLAACLAIARCDDHQRSLDVARDFLEAVVADAVAEILSGDVLELVRFVDDRAVAIGDDLSVRALSDGGIRAEQVMVHDDHI